MREVVITGTGMTRFGKFLNRSLKSLAAEAVREALDDAGAAANDIGMVFFANSLAGLVTGQESIRGQVSLRDTGLQGTPIINVENACASGSSAVHLAWLTVASGQCEAALAVGAEKLHHEDKQKAFDALMTALDVERLDEIRGLLGATTPEARRRSVFMDVYAERALRFAGRTGATEKDFAQVAVKNHAHGALNPKAQYRNKVTIEEVLASRRIAGPLSLLMCSPVGDGAAALVLCSTEYARRRSAPNPVRILATTVQSGREGQAGELVPKTARAGYETAGLGPGDLDVVECHDATTPAELVLYEQLGLCAPGDAAKLLWSRDVELGGRVPVNPSGGLISRGHPVGATGCAQIVELASQLRGRAADRQIPGARTALAQNSGGYLGPDSAACAVTILSL